MESNIQRFLRTHPGVDVEDVRKKFPGLTDSEIEHEIIAYINLGIRPSRKARMAGFDERYSEAGTGDDDGDYDQNGDFKNSGETALDLIDVDLDSAISRWSQQARQHSKTDRYFSDGWWSVWNPPPPVGWERREQEERIAPLLKVAEREPLKITDQWRPQSGYVDENDYRGLGEGLSSQRSCAVKPPPPMPTGQASPNASYWNTNYGVDRLLYARRSLNILPAITDPTPSFEGAISASIGAADLTRITDNDFKKAA
jgi:hypothetical protein